MDFQRQSFQSKQRYIWRILLIDDDEDEFVLVRQMLAEAREGKFMLEWASSFTTGLQTLKADRTFDAVLVDYDMGAHTGIEIIQTMVANQYPAPILLLTGRGTYEVDVEAMQSGAADYLSKNEINSILLERAIRYAIERKRQELALSENEARIRESEERFRTLFSTMRNGFAVHEVICDPDGTPVDYRFIEVNPAFESLTGLKGTEIIGKTVREVLPEIDQFWIDTYGRVALTAEPTQFENFATPLNRYYQVYAFCPRHGQFATIFSDITERIQTESSLRESEARFKALFNNQHSVMLVINPDTTQIIDANPAACNFYGWSYDELLRMKITDINTQPAEVIMSILGEAQASSSSLKFQFQHRLASGEIRDVSVHSGPIWFSDQQFLFSIIHDITEQVRAEKALREAEERFRIALSNSSIAVFLTDTELRYIWFYSTAMGSMPADFIGKRDDEIIPAEKAAALIALKKRVLEERVALQEEILFDVGSRVGTLIASIEPFYGKDGELLGVIGSFFDITEQRRLELESITHHTEMEVQRRLSEYREKERQEIARDLHDGPVQDLSSLIFSVQYAKEAFQDPAVQAAFEQIRSELKETVHDIRAMINELRPPSLIRFGVTKAIQHHCDDFIEKHPEVEIERSFNPLADEIVLTDQVNLSIFRIYQEAMNNISRHAQASKVWVNFGQIADTVQLEVRDNGKGFFPSNGLLDHTLENHFGLAGMKERAEAIGGILVVTSIPDGGTAIHMTVPISQPPSPS